MSESDPLPILLFIVSAEEIKDTEDSCACSESSTQSKEHYALVPVDARGTVILKELSKLNIIGLKISSLSDSFKDKILQGTSVDVLKILVAAQPQTGNWKIYTVEETKSTVSRIFTGDNNTLVIIDEAQLRNHSFLWANHEVASMVFDVAVSANNCTLLRKLLALGIDINAVLTVNPRYDLYGGTLLHAAARFGNHDAMELLLSYGPELNVKNCCGQSPLYVAANAEQWNVAALLIVAVSSANANNDDFISVLNIASLHNQPEIVTLILQRSDFDPKDLVSFIVEASALGHKKVVEVLCQFGARGDMKDESGLTALHEAAKMRDCELLEILIRNSDDINVLADGQTPLVIAIVAYLVRGIMCLQKPLYLSGVGMFLRKPSAEVMKLFHVPVSDFYTPDVRYHVEPSTEVIKLLLEHGADPDKGAPIVSLVKLGQAEIVTLICKFGVRVNIEDESGCTASHAVDRDKETPIIASLVKSVQAETVTLLCKFGARVDIEDESGCTALHAAVFWGKTELLPILTSSVNYLKDVVTFSKDRTSPANALNDEHPGLILEFVKLILENGPDPKSGAPIISAVKMRHLEAVKRLCTFGARGDVKDESGLTALHAAARLGDPDILKILISNSDDLNVLAKRKNEAFPRYQTPLSEAIENNYGEVLNSIVKLLLDHGADPNIGAPIVHAMRHRKEEVVRLLCAFGARGDIKGYYGITALHEAGQQGSFELLRIVINNSDDLNVVAVDGMTPLSFAIAAGERKEALTEVVKLLLEKGVDVDLGNPLHLAINRMEKEVVKLLCIFGARMDLPEDFSMKTFLYDHELCSTIMCCNFNIFTNLLRWLISKEELDWETERLSKILEYNFRDVVPVVCSSYKAGTVKGNERATDFLLRFLIKIYVFDLKTSQSVPEILQNVLRSFFGPTVGGDHFVRTYSEEYDLQSLIEMCLVEVRKLKDVHVGASAWTLHDVLTKNVQQLARLARTDDFQKPLDLELEFPQYGRIVEYQRQKGCQKRQLLDQALTVSGRIFGDLPIEVTEKILEKLSILDLPAFEIACSSS